MSNFCARILAVSCCLVISGLLLGKGAYLSAQEEPSALNLSERLKQKLSSVQGQDYEAHTKRAQILLDMYEVSQLQGEGDLVLVEQGQQEAQMALKLKPDDPKALLLWATHSGIYAGEKKSLSSLFVIDDLIDAFEKIKKIDPKFSKAAADRGLGAIYLHAPRFISVGSKKKAKVHLERAYQAFPGYVPNRLGWAEYLIETGQNKAAREILKETIEITKSVKHPVQREVWQKKAQALLKETGENQ